jgi:hypothetical protein
MTITIPKKFCGPPDSGNGGYVCGLLDRYTDYLSEVTLKKPIPLDKEMNLVQAEDTHCLMDGEDLIAYARPGDFYLQVPEPPSFEEAEEAAKNYAGLNGQHIFPGCFVCGPDHQQGLYIFAGRHGETQLYASPWIPDRILADKQDQIKTEFIWAALDCPGYFSIVKDQPAPFLLGRMTAKILQPITAYEKCTVIGWDLGRDGKKHFCGTAVFNEKEELCAAARGIWFKI